MMLYRITVYDNDGHPRVVTERAEKITLDLYIDAAYKLLQADTIRSVVVSRITGREKE